MSRDADDTTATPPGPDATTALLQGLGLQWEQLSHYAKGTADSAFRRCAGDLYEIVGIPAARMDECRCGRYRFQHATDEPCMDATTGATA